MAQETKTPTTCNAPAPVQAKFDNIDHAAPQAAPAAPAETSDAPPPPLQANDNASNHVPQQAVPATSAVTSDVLPPAALLAPAAPPAEPAHAAQPHVGNDPAKQQLFWGLPLAVGAVIHVAAAASLCTPLRPVGPRPAHMASCGNSFCHMTCLSSCTCVAFHFMTWAVSRWGPESWSMFKRFAPGNQAVGCRAGDCSIPCWFPSRPRPLHRHASRSRTRHLQALRDQCTCASDLTMDVHASCRILHDLRSPHAVQVARRTIAAVLRAGCTLDRVHTLAAETLRAVGRGLRRA